MQSAAQQKGVPASAANRIHLLAAVGFHGQLGLIDYENQAQPQLVRTVERDRPVALYQGQPDDVQLAVVSAGSSHTASISRK